MLILPISVATLLEHEDLLAEHHAEMGTGASIRINREFYEQLASRGDLILLGAFEGDTPDSPLVGYSAAQLFDSMHEDLRMAISLAVFMRKGRNGLRLMRDTESRSADCGAQKFLWPAKSGSRMHDLLSESNYKVGEIIYVKELGPCQS